MKTRYVLLAFSFLCFVLMGQAQPKLKSPEIASSSAKFGGSILGLVHYSPDISEHIDHEPCVADHLTNDWIERAGIAEKYAAEKLEQKEMVERYASDERAIHTIPVIFHVIYNTPDENVSTEDIYALLDEVNEDFSASNPDVGEARDGFGFVPADVDIEFCLAKQNEVGVPLDEYGIHRVPTVETWFNPATETNKMKSSVDGGTGTEPWDRDNFLNIWICDITNGAMSGVAGYAYKPTIGSLPPAFIDGIVIDYNLGMTPGAHILTHEIGHFLGLDHPWGDGDGSCVEDDELDDTPNTAGPSFDFPGTCSGDQETCPGTQTQYENFMDYSNCTVMFTEDQSTLMHLVLEYSRAPLTLSSMCEPAFPEPPVADFEADVTAVIVGGSINFTDLSDNYPTSWLWDVSPSPGVSFIDGTSETSENPVIQFDEPGFYTITLTATNGEGSDDEIKVDYIEVIDGGLETAVCDTARNYTGGELDNATYYGVDGEAGYYPAQFTLAGGLLISEGIAEQFNAGIPTFVHKLRFPIVQLDDIEGPSNVTFRVWDDAGGEPGAVLGTQVVALSDLDEGFYNIVEFPGGVAVSGDYWVGMEYDYSAGFDTLLLATTDFADRPSGPESTTSVLISGETDWIRSSALFGSEPDCSLIIEVLTSLGPEPVSIVSWPEPETCEDMEVTMNGFGSLYTTDYYWNISDGEDDYYYDEPNLTAAFDEGEWTISLTAHGSCQSDESEEFVLTVNPSLDVDVSTNPENCGAEDGEIIFDVSGGDGGPYSYSINGGATFFPTSTFTDLSSGLYEFVVEDEGNCAAEGEVTIAEEIDFFPTITGDHSILLGESTELIVTGGVSWAWYEGATYIDETASITVTPTETTTYICYVSDGEGCDVELEVTVSIIDDSGIEESEFAKNIQIYPNPTTGKVFINLLTDEESRIEMQLFNVMGAQVLNGSLTMNNQSAHQVDLSDLSAGVYYLVLSSQNEFYTKKIVLSK